MVMTLRRSSEDQRHRSSQVAIWSSPSNPLRSRAIAWLVRHSERAHRPSRGGHPVCSAARCRTRPLGDSPADSPERSAGWVLYYAAVQLGGEPVDLPGQLRVGLEFKLLLGEVVVGLRLLERRLPVLADHHER